MDAHDIPDSPAGRFTKITSLEQAEHVGVRRYQSFMCKIFNLLDDDGIFLLQVAGLRPSWQYEDLIWWAFHRMLVYLGYCANKGTCAIRGMFMNKYIFPGADASCSLGWHINQLESAGFEVKSIDVLGVHYSATIWRWYMNWLQNAGRCSEKYGEKLDRVWRLFLAWSVIVARQGGSSVFQVHKMVRCEEQRMSAESFNVRSHYTKT